MTIFQPLFSGSSGNCSLIRNQGGALLVDAGVSCRSIVSALAQADILPRDLNGILVTHEHVDHIKGLAVLTKRFKIPVYASLEVLEYLQDNNCVSPDCPLYELSSPMEVGGMLVTPFDTPHDSVHSLGFRIDTSDGASIGIATDLGAVTEQVKAGLTGCDVAMLESNYDSSMLACSPYPYYLTRRIQSGRGHLDNLDCAEELAELIKQGTKRFVLCHLSKENNIPELALQTVYARMAQEGIAAGDFELCAARRSEPTPQLIL